jgi:hypothetical protein
LPVVMTSARAKGFGVSVEIVWTMILSTSASVAGFETLKLSNSHVEGGRPLPIRDLPCQRCPHQSRAR